MSESPSRTKRRGGVTSTLPLVVGLAILTFFLLATWFGLSKNRTVQQRWEEAFGSLETVLERYPSRPANDSALTLERLVAEFGVQVSPRSTDRQPLPPPQAAADYERIHGDLSNYLRRQLELARRELEPPPTELVAFLETYAEPIGKAREHLIDNPPPMWERRLEDVPNAPLPNMLGLLYLQKLLLTDALVHSARGDHRTAVESLEASWRLNADLREEPMLIAQLVALSTARSQAGVLRHLDEVPEDWSGRLDSAPYRSMFLEALRFEGWAYVQLDVTQTPPGNSSLWQAAVGRVTRPYVRYCLADLSDDYRERVENLAVVKVLCDTDLAARGAEIDVPVPRWNLVGDMMLTNMTAGVDRLRRLELDLELTSKLLTLQGAREAGGHTWPTSVPGIEQSQTCPGDHWIYETAPDGSMSIEFSRPISWPHQISPILPTHFTAAP